MNKLALFFLTATLLSGCAAASSISSRHDTAAGIAGSAGMNEMVLQAGTFNLTSWERVQQPGTIADVYIEGDGLAWLDKHRKSLNPTPPDPLALRLAAADRSSNVIYIARPCQYTGWNGDGSCPDIYWTTGVAAPEVIAAYDQALNALKAHYQLTGFNLIGYSGGAAIAVLAAARRSDVLSLRTIAGNLDYAAFSALHEVSPIKDSIDPVTVAPALANIPQLHFIGGEDKIVPYGIYDAWKQASGNSACVHSTVMPENTHNRGWAENWASYLGVPVFCAP